MGAIPGVLGLGGGAAGTSFQGPQFTNLIAPTNPTQNNAANAGTQASFAQQQALLAALQGQGGLGLQNQAAMGYANLAAGRGPNPALAQLNQTTAQNVAQTGALMAGQRGASQNVGLIARQAGQQGAATQQQAAGQAATMAAQQQIAGLQGLAGQANTMAGQQIGQTNAITQAQQAQQANLMSAINAYNNARVGMQGNVNAGNVSLANTQMQGAQGAIGNLMNSGGQMMSMIPATGAAHGGMIGMAQGGEAAPNGPQSEFGQFLAGVTPGGNTPSVTINSVDDAAAGAWAAGPKAGPQKKSPGNQVTVNSGGSTVGPAQPGEAAIGGNAGASVGMGGLSDSAAPPSGNQAFAMADGGDVSVMLSPGEKVVYPSQVNQVAHGGKVPMKTVPGKAEFKGDSLKNDKVPASVPAGTIIVPRSKAKSPASFVQATLAKRGRR